MFREPRNGYVAHSAASQLLAENANNIQDMVGLTIEEWAPAYNRVCIPSPRMEKNEANANPNEQTVHAMTQFPNRRPNETVCILFLLAVESAEKLRYELRALR